MDIKKAAVTAASFLKKGGLKAAGSCQQLLTHGFGGDALFNLFTVLFNARIAFLVPTVASGRVFNSLAVGKVNQCFQAHGVSQEREHFH